MARIATGGGGFVSINDDDREEYVQNDEGLYLEMRRYQRGLRAYVRAHRDEIDAVIAAMLQREPGR